MKNGGASAAVRLGPTNFGQLQVHQDELGHPAAFATGAGAVPAS